MISIIKKITENEVALTIDTNLYHREVITISCNNFISSGCVFMKEIVADKIIVHFSKAESCLVDLNILISSFCKDLLEQQMKFDAESIYHNIRERIVNKAFANIDE